MRCALTGATGFVGGELARQLRAAGHEVRALARTPAKAAGLESRGCEVVTGDLDDVAALDALLTADEPLDGFFHVAGWYRVGERDPRPGWTVNVDGTRNALDAARRAGVRRIVYTSTLAVNSDTRGVVLTEDDSFTGRHISTYDETKARAHAIADAYAAGGLPVVTVMPGGIYGPGDTSQVGELIAQVVAGRRPQVPRRGGRLVWAHVADVARGHILALEQGEPGRSYMLAGEPATLAELLTRTAQIAGTKPPPPSSPTPSCRRRPDS
ncbi:NAD-dependent epimerase/dehydratase family protein [Luteipulveratus sp. YIM 133132]|uniref:NAD-dependent epimerase/dehydratase family protein n=1 Tax=Luteipulveratus flavus TaxID=3031728 RepID=UPI0023AFE2C8|nr:NAD-dependent epimerase/dehydratase family protein [Luteipulveratus sp. YIM 133132]MDE9367355.1 NAD-dependent epimerase/dehydratase family protein [Luteipulveratus sp. YIM 133132]